MSAWVGPLGALVEFAEYKGSLSVGPASRSSFKRTLGGTVFEQRGPRGRRVWDVSTSADPAQAASFSALVDGAYGPPPWVWVDPLAAVTNLFSPEQALLSQGTYSTGTGITQGGAGFTADGIRYGRSVNALGANVSLHYRDLVVDRLPVLPGVPVTGSVYASGPAYVRMSWLSEFGSVISSVSGQAGDGVMTRRTLTATPPAGAASVQVIVMNPTALALPSLTWTPFANPWAAGKGCTRATIDGLSEDVEVVDSGRANNQWSSFSFTVQELG